MNRKRISIWGSTGSIGTQTLDVIGRYRDHFQIINLTTHSNIELILEQAKQFRPKCVVITGKPIDRQWKVPFKKLGVKCLEGRHALLEVAGCGEEDLVINGLVGSVGLEATLLAIQKKVTIGLANKEVLVMAGQLVTSEVKKYGVRLLPIDSEHSAIFQSLQGENLKEIKRVILTASGGPFLEREKSEFESIKVEEALSHPNWSMGKKITIDSATLMNKGLEVIEARWLFDLDHEKVEVIIHPQSIIHSMVEFVDGSIKAQMGNPDMRVPISYALTYPERWPASYGSMDFNQLNTLQFIPPDCNKFPALQLAYEALKQGGTAPAVLNGADEVAVELFLNRIIQFNQISQIIEGL